MKLVITCLITLAVASGLALLAMDDPGYIVLAREPYVIRMPLLMMVLILFVAFIVMYLFFNFLAGIFKVPKRYRDRRKRMNEKAVQKLGMQGYAGLIEGRWEFAESRLLKHLDANETPLMNYLGAAYAAQQQGNLRRRNQYFDQALEKQPDQSFSIYLTRARFNYQSGELLEAKSYLEFLRRNKPRSRPVIRLLADVYKNLEDWQSLRQLLPAIEKLKIFSPEEFEQREQDVFDHLVAPVSLLPNGPDSSAMEWKHLPLKTRKNPKYIASYVSKLNQYGDTKQAETILRRALRKSYNPQLMRLYGMIQSPFVEYQIELAESFLAGRPNEPEIPLTLARLYRYNKAFVKAKEMYFKAIESGGGEEVYADLASLLEDIGEKEAALLFYKKQLETLVPQTKSDGSVNSEKGDLTVISDQRHQSVKSIIPVVR